MREAAALLGWSVAECCERMFAPVGLDLGGDGAEAIALAVVAEIQACVQGKLGARGRMTAEDVAEQVRGAGRRGICRRSVRCERVIAAVVLAAGASPRLGEPKQLVKIGGETLLERAVRVAREAGC